MAKGLFEELKQDLQFETGHEAPRVAIERGTPQDCVGTEQAEEY